MAEFDQRHEVMNAAVDLRYVTPGGFAAARRDEPDSSTWRMRRELVPRAARGWRVRAADPDARVLADQNLRGGGATPPFADADGRMRSRAAAGHRATRSTRHPPLAGRRS
ncbi:MAG: hypothetical protein HS111_06470 [Kofleriaceae bacterium]|nr:hypothetical protein [Kofleriaceae bacterium]